METNNFEGPAGDPPIDLADAISAEDGLTLFPFTGKAPTVLYSFGFKAEELLAVYAALRTYLRVSVDQEQEDFKTIARVAGLLNDIKPRVVEASQSLASKS